MHKNVAVSKLDANPFRRLESYPIDRDKVDALKDSYRETTYWGNILCREVSGRFQIAYGHHRLVALKECKETKVDVIVRSLSDEDMIRIMARENMEEWGSNASIETETLRATLDAFAEGRISLGKVPRDCPKSKILYAPLVSNVGSQNENEPQRQYTKHMLAKFLGWTKSDGKERALKPNFAFQTAFRALELIEQGYIEPKHIQGKKREEGFGVSMI